MCILSFLLIINASPEGRGLRAKRIPEVWSWTQTFLPSLHWLLVHQIYNLGAVQDKDERIRFQGQRSRSQRDQIRSKITCSKMLIFGECSLSKTIQFLLLYPFSLMKSTWSRASCCGFVRRSRIIFVCFLYVCVFFVVSLVISISAIDTLLWNDGCVECDVKLLTLLLRQLNVLYDVISLSYCVAYY